MILAYFPTRNQVTQITEWDWHYRVGFDLELAKKIESTFVSALGLEYSLAEVSELKAYRELISIDALVNQAIVNPDRCNAYAEQAFQNQLLHLPLELQSIIIERISFASSLSVSQKDLLIKLCHYAANAKFINHDIHLTEMVLGTNFIDIASDQYSQNHVEDFPRPSQEPNSNIDFILSLLERYQQRLVQYGLSNLPSFIPLYPVWQIEACLALNCYAEYWPSLVTGIDNHLVLGKALLSATQSDIIGTFVHEISGHACFYELVRNGFFGFIDHGAICLIEGWATWCEWNSPFCSSEHKLQLRHRAFTYLRDATEQDVDKVIILLSNIGRESRLSPVMKTQLLMDYFQYPAFSLSYYLGAAWFELYSLGCSSIVNYWIAKQGGKLTNVL